MMTMVGRTILVRVRPNGLLVFKLYNNTGREGQRQHESGEEHDQRQLMRAEDGEGSPADTRSAAVATATANRAEGGRGLEVEPARPKHGFWQKVSSSQNHLDRVHLLVMHVTQSRCAVGYIVEWAVARRIISGVSV